MKMNNVEVISKYLDEVFPNPKPELIFHTDYELLIAVMLSAQTTDKRVNMVTKVLFSKYNGLEGLMEANINDLEDIIHPLGSFRKKAQYTKDIASILVNNYNGVVPRDKDILVTLPGIGRKTANVFLSEFYNEPEIAVDTHVERVSKRLKLAYLGDDVLKVELKLQRKFPKSEWSKRHLQLVLFGRYKCKAIKPDCSDCKLKDICRDYKKINKKKI